MKALLSIAFALAAAGPARSETPTAVLSSESEHYRLALAGFTEAWGSTVPVVSEKGPLPPEAWAFAAIGGRAAARRWPKDAVVVACLAPAVPESDGDEVTRVSLMPDPEVLIDRLRALAPKLKVLRAFWSSESSRGDTERLIAAGAKHGLIILSERILPAGGLPERLRGFKEKADGLWLMPDPALVNAENFFILREYAAAEKVPFFAPTEGLVERGATATIAVSFGDMGRAAARSLRGRLAGRAEPEVVYVSSVTVTVGAAAARAAGLGPRLDSADKVLP